MSGDQARSSDSLPYASEGLDSTPNAKKFVEYYRLANQFIREADKAVLSEAARSLAIDIAYYRMKHGATPIEETRAVLDAGTLNDDQMAQLADAMMYLVAAIRIAAAHHEKDSDITSH